MASHSFNAGLFTDVFNAAAPASGAAVEASATLIEEVISINGMPMESSVTKVTHLRSPDKAHEKIPGFMDAGQINFRLNYSREGMAALVSLLPTANPSIEQRFTAFVLFPDFGVWQATVFLKSMPVEIPEDDRNTIDAVFEISGKPVFFEFSS